MTDKTIDLDHHRGMAAQKATDLRRLLADVEANEKALRLGRDELESHLLAAPAANLGKANSRKTEATGVELRPSCRTSSSPGPKTGAPCVSQAA